jgi:hypothetical protein
MARKEAPKTPDKANLSPNRFSSGPAFISYRLGPGSGR